jgi:restriction endonuclease S subunit
MSFFCSKFTTIAQYEWFQDVAFKLEDFAEYKVKSEKLANWVFNLSYSKAFSCRPCHCFWISWISLYFALQIESSIYALIFSFVSAIIIYFMAKGLGESKIKMPTIQECKELPWINSRSQYGSYDAKK